MPTQDQLGTGHQYFVFRPTIARSATNLYELPRTCQVCDVTDTWDFDQQKVPLRAGNLVDGISRNAVRIELQGLCARQGNKINYNDPLLFTEFERLRQYLDASTGLFEFFLVFPKVSGEFRKFKSCYCDRFQTSLGEQAQGKYDWSATIVALDPTLYATGPFV